MKKKIMKKKLIVQNGFGLLPNCIVTRAVVRLGIVLQYEVYCKKEKKFVLQYTKCIVTERLGLIG